MYDYFFLPLYINGPFCRVGRKKMNIKQTVIRIKNTLKSAKTEEFCTNRKNEATNILPKNAQNPQETAKNAGISAEATNKREVKATQPVESGRSMVEMLGVLAVIGVLSVAGIAGYQYAMNKYRANQIAHELNLAGNQIVFALTRPHNEDYYLTLGAPYDDGTLSSGFAFTYGCGTDTEMIGCLVDDTAYYETLSGLPEDLCKSVAQLTQNLPYLVEQRVNDTVDTMGTSCNGDNNEIVMLFEINELSTGLPSEDLPFIPITHFGECSTNADCFYGICSHGICIGCATDADCGTGRCAKGFCYECIQDSDCPNDDVYKYNTCVDFRCWPEKMAESVKCSQDSDCSEGKLCIDGHCSMCRSDVHCPSDKPFCVPNVWEQYSCTSNECNSNTDCTFIGKTTCVYDEQNGGNRCQ